MIDSLDKLLSRKCRPIGKSEGVLDLSKTQALRALLSNWEFCATNNQLCKTYRFDSYSATINFVNRVAEIAEQQDHHPELIVSYQRCKVIWLTHSVNGLTENDFICAALIDQV